MDREAILSKMTQFLKEALMSRGTELEIKPDDNFTDDLRLDSMGAVEFVTMVEDEYDIRIGDDEFLGIETLNGAVDLLLTKKAQE